MKKEKISIAISGMHCASCAANIEKGLKKVEAVESVNVNFATEKATIEFQPDLISAKQIEAAIREIGYTPTLEQEKEKQHELVILKKRFWLSFFFGLPVILMVMLEMVGVKLPEMIMDFSVAIQLILSTIVIYFSWPIWKSGFKSLVKLNPGMDSLVFVGTATAYLYSLILAVNAMIRGTEVTQIYFESAIFILIFISLGKYLEAITKGKTSQAIKRLINLEAKEAVVWREGKEIRVPINEVVVGDLVSVKPGEKIPVDGEIIEGYSGIDEQAITGESIPREAKAGDQVVGSTINKTGFLKIRATRVGAETTLAQIIKIVEEATGSKAPIQELADKFSYYFTPSVIVIALSTLAFWLIAGHSVAFALTAFVSVLIIACPCAMGLATPTAVMMGTGLAAERGILIKSGEALEKAVKIKTVVFDKTGTITWGKPKVTDIIPIKQHFDKKYLLQVVSSVERQSEHPLAEAIVNLAKEKSISALEISDFQAIPGKGIEAKFLPVGSKLKSAVRIGTAKILINEIEKENQLRVDRLEKEGKTVMIVAIENEIVGLIALADTIKESSKEAIRLLKKMRIETVLLTGDNLMVARAVGREVGIERVIAEVLPQDKAKEIEKIKAETGGVAMVGDGINDSPALAMADLGIAMGGGTDIAIETGEIVLMKNDLRDVVKAIELSRFTIKKIRQNLFWAFIYNIVGIPIAAGALYSVTGWLLSPSIAAAAMAMSSVSVVSNSILMKKFR